MGYNIWPKVVPRHKRENIKRRKISRSQQNSEVRVVNLLRLIDDSAKGGLTQFWEHFTMIPCAPKYLKR